MLGFKQEAIGKRVLILFFFSLVAEVVLDFLLLHYGEEFGPRSPDLFLFLFLFVGIAFRGVGVNVDCLRLVQLRLLVRVVSWWME